MQSPTILYFDQVLTFYCVQISQIPNYDIAVYSSRSLQEGQDIFGVDFDYDEFEKYGEEDYEDEEDEDLDEYIEDEEEEGKISPKFFSVCE